MISTGCDMDYRQSSRAVHVGRYRQGSSTVMAGGFVACQGNTRGNGDGVHAKQTLGVGGGGGMGQSPGGGVICTLPPQNFRDIKGPALPE